MGVQERERTLTNIARLREAERKARVSEIAVVREDLESQLGGTIPRASAARHLGISHTALNRWVASGDVPVVITKEGRKEVPIPVLLELRERVDEQQRSGKRRLHALEPILLERRRRAERLRPQIDALSPNDRQDSHRVAELRSLAYHRAVATRLRRPMVEEAERKLLRWEYAGTIDPRYAQAWKEVFAMPMNQIRKAITADDERGRDLRQNSPLGGLLTEPERRRILNLT